MIYAAGERDYSAQETAHMILSLPLVAKLLAIILLQFNGERRLQNDELDELVLDQSNIDHYSNQTLYLNLSLIQFFSTYFVQNKDAIIFCHSTYFPQYSSNPNGDKYNLHASTS